jgi:hypothetical protein
LPLLHFVLTHKRGELPPVELHWWVRWYERAFACERLLPPSVEVAVEWRPAPADELAALLLFYARDGFVGLRLASDLGARWDVYGEELPPGGLEELLGAYPRWRACCQLRRVWWSGWWERIFADARRLGVRQRVAVQLANPNPRSSQSQLYADMGLIDGLLAPRGGFGAFVRRRLLPALECSTSRPNM